ncbi:MAG: transglycosylase domain-containing protein [Microthrixaceae bacterium]
MRAVGYGALVLAVVAVGGLWAALNTLRLPPAQRPIETSFVCDLTVADGQCGFDNAMARLTAEEERVTVRYEDLPPVMVQAVLAAEDRNFFEHNGVDPMGIGRALYQTVLGDSESQQGGSTITQQYVKNVYLSSERTLDRKAREAVLAVKLERELGKREILTRYLNEVYFGRGAYGVEAASRTYFGVGVKDLQLPQAAYLASLIRSPETADAVQHPKVAERRRRSVLDGMVATGAITRAQADAAAAEPFVTDATTRPDGTVQPPTIRARVDQRSDFGDVKYTELGSEYWVEWVRQQLRARYGPGAETRGLRVYTTFDPTLQKAAVDSVYDTLDVPDGPTGSLVAVDKDGRIRAMVGGRDYATDKVNLALGGQGGGSGRAPGSTFKPFALAAFIEDGYSVKSRFRAPPTTQFPGVYAGAGQVWKPANYDKADHGIETVEQATWNSTNTVYAGMVDTIRPERLAEMARRLGVTATLDPVYSLVLGAEEVSVLDMASAYSTFMDRGTHISPYSIRRIEAADGTVLFDASTAVERRQAIQPAVADTVTTVLQGVLQNGTGQNAELRVPAAGKTGTTNDAKDAWFTGYTCDLTAAVWMGYEQPREMRTFKGQQVAGGTVPAAIWRNFMSKATRGSAPCRFPSTDAGKRILNSSMSPSSGGSTTSSVPRSSTSSTVPGSSTTSSSVPGSTTTTAPRPTTTAPRPTTTVAPTTAPPAPAAPAAVPPG